MIHLEMTPTVSEIRAYDQPGGYENRLPYLAILKVTYLSTTHVYLSGAVGTVDRETWTKAFAMLKEQGVTTVQIERRGRMRLIPL